MQWERELIVVVASATLDTAKFQDFFGPQVCFLQIIWANTRATQTNQNQKNKHKSHDTKQETEDPKANNQTNKQTPLLEIPGRMFPVVDSYVPCSDTSTAVVNAIALCLQLHNDLPIGEGDILVFLTGQEDTEFAK